jgi:hypothetical protein
MTDDLTTRLRAVSRVPLAREALAHIEALEAERDFERGRCARLAKMLDARDALIAEALVVWYRGMEHSDAGEYVVNDATIEQAMTDLWDALSRVPQGAAEPAVEAYNAMHRGEQVNVADLAPAVRRVAPDQETDDQLFERYVAALRSQANPYGRFPTTRETFDHLLASGVLGVPTDQVRAEQREADAQIAESYRLGDQLLAGHGKPVHEARNAIADLIRRKATGA